MSTEADIKEELGLLIEAVTEDLLPLTDDAKQTVDFGKKYQNWYTRALKLVELLGKDRLEEFSSYYRIDPKRKLLSATNYVVQDYVNGFGARRDHHNKPLWDVKVAVQLRVINQSQILESLQSRIDTVLSDVKGHLLADIQDEELKIAQRLVSVSLRGAGAVAGVVLESHLQRVAENHSIKLSKKNPTIADLNDPLKANGVYATPTWRKVQHMADIRNYCDHKKEREPTKEEVLELIAGVSSIVKSVF